jgi:hypothetical protein
MATTRKYRVLISWTHRKWGPQQERQTAEGSSIRRALSNALLAFFSDKSSRDRRRDAHTNLDVKIRRLKSE